MLDNQMFELLDKLKKVNYETIDIDDFLDQRERDPFDSEWVRVYQAIEELKKGKEMVDTREIEKKAYIAKFAFSMFWQAIQFAEKHQVPVLLDY